MVSEPKSVTLQTCWVLTDGKPGMENQCLGLAEALGLRIERKHIHARLPWKLLPPRLWFSPLRAGGPGSDPLRPPWPDMLIATGRATVAPAIAIRRASRGATFTVQIQNPGAAFDQFDMVVPPHHDCCVGPNVFSTRGALHRVTPERLAVEAAHLIPELAHLPRPLVAVLVGGTNRVYRMTPEIGRNLARQLAALARECGAGILVTSSRRTDESVQAALREALATTQAVIWNGTEDNPYFGYLGMADFVVVTADSVSMVSEACSTGKPVYVVEPEGGSVKFRRFHDSLRADGITRRFTGVLERWNYVPLDDTARVAAEVRRRLQSR
ncbi:MAG: mitochondrial fission ELM1 family protein [Acidiferrobacterales bacterium]